jgi:membrane protein
VKNGYRVHTSALRFAVKRDSLSASEPMEVLMAGVAIIVLCGAELNSEIEHQTARDTTIGHPKPLGARGAVMADTLGPAVPTVSKEL